MLSEDTLLLFRILNDKFTRGIENSDELSKLLALTKDQLSFLFTEKNLEENDRKELSLYMFWFINQLLYVLVNDKNRM
jgi:hypothetical protein